ncbi:hypothetical protein DXG01_003545 [Tephrocybe rancida]|nr:hypothetical protein DXG01_003545 [Tephrocybe rancida]
MRLTHPSLPPCPEPSTIPLPPQSRPASANHSHRSNNILRPTPIHLPLYDRPYSPPRLAIDTFRRVPFQPPYPLPHHGPLDPRVSYTKPVRFVFTLQQSVHKGAFSDHLHSTIRVVTEDAEERTFLIIEDISPVVQPQFRYPFPNVSIRDLLENYPPRTVHPRYYFDHFRIRPANNVPPTPLYLSPPAKLTLSAATLPTFCFISEIESPNPLNPTLLDGVPESSYIDLPFARHSSDFEIIQTLLTFKFRSQTHSFISFEIFHPCAARGNLFPYINLSDLIFSIPFEYHSQPYSIPPIPSASK